MAFENGLEIIPDNSVLCIEEKTGNIKTIYALYVAAEQARRSVNVTYLTLQSREDILRIMTRLRIPRSDLIRIIELPPDQARHEILTRIQEPDTPIIIIDPFAVFFAEESFSNLNNMLYNLTAASRKGTTFLLLLDIGVLPERQENLVRTMADGVIQFVIIPEGDKIKNYINIPKMRGAFPRDKMLPFTVNEEGLLIDTRERHG
jgi:KaiC/GvpD/RAD55 family RecA-like ATPase